MLKNWNNLSLEERNNIVFEGRNQNYGAYELRKNYKDLGYSITEVSLQMLKLSSYPLYFFLMTIFSSLLMLRMK